MPEIDKIFSQCYQDMFQGFAQLLISNKNKITLLKETMKNPEKRDEILKFNEPYLESLEGKKNAQKKKSILTDC